MLRSYKGRYSADMLFAPGKRTFRKHGMKGLSYLAKHIRAEVCQNIESYSKPIDWSFSKPTKTPAQRCQIAAPIPQSGANSHAMLRILVHFSLAIRSTRFTEPSSSSSKGKIPVPPLSVHTCALELFRAPNSQARQ